MGNLKVLIEATDDSGSVVDSVNVTGQGVAKKKDSIKKLKSDNSNKKYRQHVCDHELIDSERTGCVVEEI